MEEHDSSKIMVPSSNLGGRTKLRIVMCKCKVCNKQFNYGDEQSPMFTNEIWERLLDFYGLKEYEHMARVLFNANWRNRKRKPFRDKDKYHCYLCYECAEKALGRKILPEDINDSMYNTAFRRFYYGKET